MITIHENAFLCSLTWTLISFCSLEVLKLVPLPAEAYSASLHPDKSVFVAGGEDFKIYKFTYDDGKEVGECLQEY